VATNKKNKDLVLEYVRAYRSTSSWQLAGMLMKEFPGHYKSLDAARSSVRYYRGAIGTRCRAWMAKDSYTPRITAPRSDCKSLEPFVIGYDSFPVIIGGDAHFPYHDEDAVDMFFDRAATMGAKTIVLLGDWMDMYQASSFIKDPRSRRIPEEVEMMRDFLAGIRKAFPGVRIIYKIGNHEDRLETYLKSRAPELYGLDDITLANLLRLEESGIEVVPSRQMMKIGKLYALHGHEVGKGVFSPVNPARGLYLKTKKSAICAHYHQTSEHVEKNLDDKVESCWTIGCLCNMKPEYMPVNRWNHGFAEVYAEDDMYTVKNRKIINYRVV